jgi:3-dehydroquinate synthase
MVQSNTRIKITVPQRSYEAIIESGLLANAGPLVREVLGKGKRLFVVTVEPVRRRWGKKLVASLATAGFDSEILEMKDGERSKKLASVEQLAEKLTRLGADRNAAIVAFGGGVIGDVAGFVASVYMRGIDVVQIPTTVQAQLDAAIGGKTGVNLRTGKNLVGTFHQPAMVLIDPAVLSTLPEREFRAGLYEALKCGVIGRPELFERLDGTKIKALRRDMKTLEWVLAESVQLKADVVSADEREGDLRRVLNLGHTIGHALEAESEYKRFLHGEAVAWGMIAATSIAVSVGKLEPKIAKQIVDAVLSFGPLPKVKAKSKKIVRLLQSDKKTSHGVVHFVLPTAIGKVEIVKNVPEQVIVNAVDELRNLSDR